MKPDPTKALLARHHARKAERIRDHIRQVRRTIELELQAEQPWHKDRIAGLTLQLEGCDMRMQRMSEIADRNWAVWEEYRKARNGS